MTTPISSFRLTDEERAWIAAADRAGATGWQIIMGTGRAERTVRVAIHRARSTMGFHDHNAARWRRPDVLAHITHCWTAGDALAVIVADLRERFGVTVGPSRISVIARHELGLPARGEAGWQPTGRRYAPAGRPVGSQNRPRAGTRPDRREELAAEVASRQLARCERHERQRRAHEDATLWRRCDVAGCFARFQGSRCPNGHVAEAVA